MKSRWITIFWSVMMIAAGGVFILREMELINFSLISSGIWMIIFAMLSVFFFVTYFTNGVRKWGWLFPAVILGALAAMMALEGTPVGETINGAIILIAIAIPFLAAFACEPKKHWWALIPAWVMAALAGVVLFEDRVSDNLIGAFVLYSIALPFLVVYLIDHTKRWALIPFGALAVIGLIPVLEETVNDDILGMLLMFLFAIPFFVVYFRSTANWWALIPAGVFASIGLTVFLMNLPFVTNQIGEFERMMGSALLFAGFGTTFGVLWLKRGSDTATDWAKYPAAGSFLVAVCTVLLGQNSDLLWPVMLIAGGAVIVLLAVFRKPGAQTKKPKE